MGGEQAASVLATVRRDGIEAKAAWSAEEEDAFKQPIRDQYERQGIRITRARGVGRRRDRPRADA